MPHQTDAAAVAARWASNLSNSTQKITAGVNAVTQSPGQMAAQNADKWQLKVSSADAKAKFSANTAKMTVADWKSSMINKGIPRISTGANDAKPKFTQFMQQFLPYVNSVADQVKQMPNNTIDDAVNRAAAQIRGNHAFRRT